MMGFLIDALLWDEMLAPGLIWGLCGPVSKITVHAFGVREKLDLSNENNNKIEMSA
jgi:hypothetical protein